MENENDRRRKTSLSLPPDMLILSCIVASVLLLGASLLIHVTDQIKLIILIASAILAGYDIVLDAVTKIVREHDFEENLILIIPAAGLFLTGRPTEGAAVMVLFRIGEYLRKKVVEKSTNTIEGVMDLRPDVVNAVVSGAIVRKAAGKIRTGDIISVAPGERFAVDGVVISGESEVDTSALTGTAAARVTVREGSDVLSGCLNLTGVLNIRVTDEFDNTMVSRILRFVEKNESKKASREKSIARFGAIFTPAVIAAALIIGLLVPLLGKLDFISWLGRAFGFLAVSGSGALVAAVSLTYFAGIGGAAKKGILLKDASVVDAAAHTTSVIFDKTGTLTTGSFKVSEVLSDAIPSDKLLMLGAYAELYSEHPIARAIVQAAGIEPDYSRIANYREIPGRGTEVEVGSLTVAAGNIHYMDELGVIPDTGKGESSVVYIAVNGKYAGRILLTDTIKPGAKKAVRDLHGIGVDRIAMFTSDKKESAGEFAGQLGITEFYAEYVQEDKIKRLKGLTDMQLPGDKLIYVGDGVNDGQVLKIADVGAAIGGLASDETADSADMVIMSDEPSKITEAVLLARKTEEIVGQNILISLILKGVILLLVLIGLIPAWAAVIADTLVSMATVMNAMRAFGFSRNEARKRRPGNSSEEENVDAGELPED